MENIILIIVLYLIGTMVSDNAKRKKRRSQRRDTEAEENRMPPDFDIPPLDRDNPFDFEIPPIEGKKSNDFEIPKIEGAPKSKPELGPDGVYREEEEKIVNPYMDYIKRDAPEKKEKTSDTKQNIPLKVEEVAKKSTKLSTENIRYGIIMAEVLGRPKAYRRIRR